jgi:hypothetical protein
MLCDPLRSPEWAEDVIEVTGEPVKIEKGMGIEEIEAKRGIQGRVIGALHTKNFLRRAADKMLDNLRAALGGSPRGRRS